MMALAYISAGVAIAIGTAELHSYLQLPSGTPRDASGAGCAGSRMEYLQKESNAAVSLSRTSQR